MTSGKSILFDRIKNFSDQRKKEGVCGRLIGIDIKKRDQIFEEIYNSFIEELNRAREKAKKCGSFVDIDGSAISLTNGGDTWTVFSDGRLGRTYSRFNSFKGFLDTIKRVKRPSKIYSPELEDILWCSFAGVWAPSATNWEPMRLVEIKERSLKERIKDIYKKFPDISPDCPIFVLLRRDRYESLLGDVLEPFGNSVTAKEELIDAGIYSAVFQMAAFSRRLYFQEYVLSDDNEIKIIKDIVITSLRNSLQKVDIDRYSRLKSMVEEGRYIPDALFVVGRGHDGFEGIIYDDFWNLLMYRSTQRVASPGKEVQSTMIRNIFEAPEGLEQESGITYFNFNKFHTTLDKIGIAMHESLYGNDQGGGFLSTFTVENLSNFLLKNNLIDIELKKNDPIKKEWIGCYLRDRLFLDGRFREKDGIIVDSRNRPLTAALFARMMKSLASGFGRFFLKFKNTHPRCTIFCIDTRKGDLEYRKLGRIAAFVTYAARAEGLSAIIKTGPIDLARDSIGDILLENPDSIPQLNEKRVELESKVLIPALVFQVGMPLTGSDIIDPGTPDEHTGLEERRRDKRPPRQDSTDHFFPSL